ncbi:hypothetical protein GY12_22750 [Micrococcus luteus]|nr:hypothetical protein GY12_22750 [Micrococcus luteus]
MVQQRGVLGLRPEAAQELGSPVYSSLRIFTAVIRPRTLSRAFHTSPMPPIAMRSVSWYLRRG